MRHGPPHLRWDAWAQDAFGQACPDLRPRDGRPRRGPRRGIARPAGDPDRRARGGRDAPRRLDAATSAAPVASTCAATCGSSASTSTARSPSTSSCRSPTPGRQPGLAPGDRGDPGADGQRRPRRLRGGDRRPDRGRARLRPDRAHGRRHRRPGRGAPRSSRPTSTRNGSRWPGGWARTRPSTPARTWSRRLRADDRRRRRRRRAGDERRRGGDPAGASRR